LCKQKGSNFDEIGTKLMRKAFDPDKGPLRNEFLGKEEREATAHVFAGAMGLFRNPAGHRDVDLDPPEARDLIYFANHLLRLLDKIG
jgi:hypothetical protein